VTTIAWLPDRIFYQALALFKHVRIYANAYVSQVPLGNYTLMTCSIMDITVPYITAAIETEDPFAGEETNGLEV